MGRGGLDCCRLTRLACLERLIAVPLVTTVHERGSIARYTRAIVSDATMREVEASLMLHFGLPPACP